MFRFATFALAAAFGVATTFAGAASAKTHFLGLYPTAPDNSGPTVRQPLGSNSKTKIAPVTYPVKCEVIPFPKTNQVYRLAIRNLGNSPIPVGTTMWFTTDNPKIYLNNYITPIATAPHDVFDGVNAGDWTEDSRLTFKTCVAHAVGPPNLK